MSLPRAPTGTRWRFPPDGCAEADAQAAQRKAQEKKTAAAMAEPPDFQAMYPKMHASLAETNGEPKAKAKKPFEMQPRSHGGSYPRHGLTR